MSALLILLVLAGCDTESNKPVEIENIRKAIAEGKNASDPMSTESRADVSTTKRRDEKLPPIDKESLINSMPWLIEALELKKHGYRNFQITSYVVSPDNRFVIINISNGKTSDLPGPFYRFVVINQKEKQIYFPSKEILLKNDLGYPYISAVFNDNNSLAIAYGYRIIEANVISLPEGKILETKELNVFELDEINKELVKLLEKHP